MKTFLLGRNKEEVLNMVPDKQIKMVKIGDNSFCIARIGENFYVFESHCPHRKASLVQGFITSNKEVVCPLHEYRFDLENGQVRNGQCPDLKTFAVTFDETGLKIMI